MRTNVPLQEAVSVPTTTTGQKYVAAIIVATLAVVVLYQWYRTNYNGLDNRNERHLTHLRGQKLRETPAKLRIPAGKAASDYRARIRRLFSAADGNAAVKSTDSTGLPRAVWTTAVETRRVWQPFKPYVPGTALRAIQVGVLVATLGAVAVSTSWLVAWLEGGGRGLTLQTIASGLTDGTTAVLDTAVLLLEGFPYVQTLFSLAFSAAIIAVETAYTHWGWSATLLFTLALLLVLLDRQATRRDSTQLIERRPTGLATAKWAVLVWSFGALPATIGAAAGNTSIQGITLPFPALGSLLGLVLAFVTALYALYRGLRQLVQRVRRLAGLTTVYQTHEPDDLVAALRTSSDEPIKYDPTTAADALARELDATDHAWRRRAADPALAAYVLLRRVTLAAISGFLVMAGWYLVVAIADGRLARVASAAAAAAPSRQATVALVLLVPLLAVAYATRGTWGDLRSALADAWTRRTVRLAILNRGIPYAAVAIAYAMAYGFAQSIPIALVLAVTAGLAVYGISIALQRAKYRASIYEDAKPPKSVLVQAWVLEDADGTEHYYASVDGTTDVAWTDVDTVVDALVDGPGDNQGVINAISEHDDPPATDAGWHADFLLNRGFVDTEDNLQRIEEKTRTETMDRLRSAEGGVHIDDLVDDVDDLGRDRVEDKVIELWHRGYVRMGEDHVHLEHDPWAN